jgi:hypothetical protein
MLKMFLELYGEAVFLVGFPSNVPQQPGFGLFLWNFGCLAKC